MEHGRIRFQKARRGHEEPQGSGGTKARGVVYEEKFDTQKTYFRGISASLCYSVLVPTCLILPSFIYLQARHLI